MLEIILPVLYTLLQMIIPIIFGFILRKTIFFPSSFFSRLSQLIVRFALPVYFFVKISRMKVADLETAFIFPLATIIITAISILFALIVFSLAPFKSREKRAGIALGSFGNSAYLPLTLLEILPITFLPFSQYFNTDVILLYIGAYILLFSPLLWTVGNLLISGKMGKLHIKDFITPPFLGIVAGLIVMISGLGFIMEDATLPFAHIIRAAERFANITVTIVLICLGSMIADLSFPAEKRKSMLLHALLVSLVRFILLPLSFFGFYFLSRGWQYFDQNQYLCLFLQLSVPTSTNLSIMANRAGVNTDLAPMSFMVTFILYLVFFPFWLLIFLNLPGILP